MANIRSGNTYYVDSTDTLEIGALAVSSIILTSDGGDGQLILQDPAVSPATKINLKVLDGESLFIEFEKDSLFFPNGIQVSTLSNAVATIVFKENNR